MNIRYKKETEIVTFQGKEITLENLSPVFTPEQEAAKRRELIRPTLAQMLRNPVYAQADLDVYEFFKSQGTVLVNDAADFTGMNGCYLYQGRDVKPDKAQSLKDQMLVLAPHEGIVPSDIWLTCRKKLMNNMKIQSARKATHTWLAGKIKCGNCGYALMSIFNPSGRQYLRCTKRLDNKSCPGCGKIITAELEAVVYQQMVKKLEKHKTLTGRKKAAKANPKITALQVELAHVDSEIEKLVDSLTGISAPVRPLPCVVPCKLYFDIQ